MATNALWKARLLMDRGQTMTEYVLIMTAIAVALIAGWNTMGQSLDALLNSISSDL